MKKIFAFIISFVLIITSTPVSITYAEDNARNSSAIEKQEDGEVPDNMESGTSIIPDDTVLPSDKSSANSDAIADEDSQSGTDDNAQEEESSSDIEADEDGATTVSETDAPEDSPAENELTYTDETSSFDITVSRDDGFAEGDEVSFKMLQNGDVEAVMASLNDHLAKDGQVATCVLPFMISLTDSEGNDLTSAQPFSSRIHMDQIEMTDGTSLFHERHGGVWEEIPFTAFDASDTERAFVEFETTEFSPFIFVRVNEIAEEEQAEASDEPDDENIDQDTTESLSEDVVNADESSEPIEAAEEPDNQTVDTSEAAEEPDDQTVDAPEAADTNDDMEEADSSNTTEKEDKKTVTPAPKKAAAPKKAPLLGASPSSIQIHTTDYDGNDISASELGSGYDLYVYEMPASVMGLNSSTVQSRPLQYYISTIVYSKYNTTTIDWEQYKTSIHIDSQDKALRLTQEADASADNPYILILATREYDQETQFNYYLGDYTAEWSGVAGFYYDGENINIISDSATFDNNVYTVSVKHDDSLFNPKVTVTFDSADFVSDTGASPYPATLILGQSNEDAITINADGTYTFTLNQKISRRAAIASRAAMDEGRMPDAPLGALMYTIISDGGPDRTWRSTISHEGITLSSNMCYILDVDSEGNILGCNRSGTSPLFVPTDEIFTISFNKLAMCEKIRVDTKEITEGNPLSDALGDGYDLVYYDIPASQLNLGTDYEYAYQAVMSAETSGSNPYSSYRRTVHISSNQQILDLTNLTGTTAGNPYLLVFIGEDGTTLNNPATWSTKDVIWYDNTGLYATGDVQVSGNTAVVNVMHDTTLVNPKLTLHLNSSEYMANKTSEDEEPFPVNVNANLYVANNNSSITAAANEDGDVVLTFPNKISLRDLRQTAAQSMGPMRGSVNIYLNDSHVQNTWTVANADEISASIGEMGTNHLVLTFSDLDDEGNILAITEGETQAPVLKPVFSKVLSGKKPSVKVMFKTADPEDFTDEDFPVYVKARVEDCYNSNWHTEKIFEITKEDLNNEKILTFDRLDPNIVVGGPGYSDRPLTFSFEFYKDQECTEQASDWVGGSAYYSWLCNYDTDYVWGSTQWTDQNERVEVPLIFESVVVRPKIQYECFTNKTEELYPAYLKVTAFGQEEVVELTQNANGVISFERMPVWNISGQAATWTVYADQECTTVHTGWGIENKSENLYWNNDKLYGEQNNPFGINITKITTDTLTVPVVIDIGDMEESECFPVNMIAVLRDSSGNVVADSVRKMPASLAEAKGDLVFVPDEGVTFTSDETYKVSMFFTSGNDLPVKFVPGDVSGSIWGDGKLHNGMSEVKVIYKPVKVDVDPDPYLVEADDEHPLYTQVTFSNIPGKVVERHNADRFTLTNDRLMLVGSTIENVGASLNEDQNFTDPENTSKGTKWRPDYAYNVVVSSDGSLKTQNGVNSELVVLKPYEAPANDRTSTIPVTVHIPDGHYDFNWSTSAGDSWQEAAVVALYGIDPATGEQVHASANTYGQRDDNNNYYCYIRVSSLDENSQGAITVSTSGFNPGTYYMDYWLGEGNRDYAYGWGHKSGSNVDTEWTHENNVKVTLTDDGQLLYEDGTPVSLDFYYFYSDRVIPQIDVHAEYPDGSAAYNGLTYNPEQARGTDTESTPSYFHYTLSMADGSHSYSDIVYLRFNTTANGHRVQNVQEGDSKISGPNEHYDYMTYYYNTTYGYDTPEYNGPKVIDTLYDTANGNNTYGYYFGTYCYHYDDPSSVVGIPVGDYTLTYYTGSNSNTRSKWHSEANLPVHLAEDGRLYHINDDGSYDDEPYAIQIHYGIDDTYQKTVNSLKVRVVTTAKDGADTTKAFKEGDVFVAQVSERFYNGNTYQYNPKFAVGTATITETGEIMLELTSPDGSPLVMRDNADYKISYGTFHRYQGDFSDTSNINRAWPYYNHSNETYNYSNDSNYYGHISYFRSDNIDAEGNVKKFVYNRAATNYREYVSMTEEGEGDYLELYNDCLILPWTKTNPGTISQKDNDGTVVYKPISDIATIKEKGNYIIVAQNAYNNKWYALYVDEDGGNSVELSDVTSLDDLETGYKIDSSAEFKKLVFVASKVTQGSDSVSLQLKTTFKDENAKAMALKMGQSSDIPNPTIANSAGTIIIRSDGEEKQFSISKGNYSWLWYVDELFGYSGFRTVSNKFGPWWSRGEMLYGLVNTRSNTYQDYNKMVDVSTSPVMSLNSGSVYAGVSDAHSTPSKYMADIDSSYLSNPQYMSRLSSRNYGAGQYRFYILSDDVEEPPVQEQTNKYTLVKSFGDFVQTFCSGSGTPAFNMMLVYTDGEGKEYAMESDKLYRVESKPGSSSYRTITTVADHVLIPNNNSGTSASFSIEPVEIKEDGTFVFATSYAFRKSRQNNTDDKNYLTLNGEDGTPGWSKNDDATHGEGLVYALIPDNDVKSQADWETPQTYKLSVVRNGVTTWLGVSEDVDGNMQMTTVTSKEDAVSFKIYTDQLRRYYASIYGTDLYRYYKINSITDINAGDEILIVYDDNGTKRVIGFPFVESGRYNLGEDYYYSRYSLSPAVEVLPEHDTLDTRFENADTNSRYKYRFDTSEYIKKPYAYADPEDDQVIWAQGIAANAIGTAKSENNKQRKYESVEALGQQGYYTYIKSGQMGAYYPKKAETNFFPGPSAGQFYIRGGKSNAWLGTATYQRYMLSLDTGYYDYYGSYRGFKTVGQDDRIAVELYRRPTTSETFTIEYYTPENELDHKENKPQETFTLTSKTDTEKDGVQYIFVGWTTDYDKSGYLPLADSTNLYDYDDLAKLASIKSSVKSQYDLLGDCNPEADNMVDYEEVRDKVKTVTSGTETSTVLKVYPVYAVKGYSSAVTANDLKPSGEQQMIIGASDFKDLQNAGNGQVNEKERWLGSINIEVYRDGELWVPGEGGSTTGRKKLNSANPKANSTSATLYFAYHNDNAADLNIKFIADSITKDNLYEYMSNGEFTQPEPSHNYIIDAVWAEQGGSEDGLKYRYNWMSNHYGGQLDNVRGGSTVKIYVTTKYRIKYYLDNDGTGYKQLTGDAWTDDHYYSTPGTDNAVDQLQASSMDYLVEEEGDYSRLLNQTPNDGATFKDEDIARGEYQMFLYRFSDSHHTIDVADLPGQDIVGAGKTLSSDKWTIRDPSVQPYMEWSPDTDWEMTGTTYGTGNTIYSFIGNASPFTDTEFNTYHLTAHVVSDLRVRKIVDSDDPADRRQEFTFRVTLTDNVNQEGHKVNVNGWRGGIKFKDNVATFTLKHGEEVTAESLPVGVTYLVEEMDTPGYRIKSKQGETGTITIGETKEAVFTNEPVRTHAITISKTVTGNMGSKSKNFDFTLTLSGNNIPETLDYTATGKATNSGTLNVTNGTVSFTLSHDETITFPEVPDGVNYTITEARANMDGYRTAAESVGGTVSEALVTGTLSADVSASYTNSRSIVIPTGARDGMSMFLLILIASLAAAIAVAKKQKTHLR